jgi:4-hydroxy-3-polyprenylbenzoate decarboxylase
MAYASLRDFLDKLEKDGQLVRVSEPVSTVLEMTEIQTRLMVDYSRTLFGKTAKP